MFPARIAIFSKAVAAQKAQLLPYLIAVRMAPVLPSWFVNLAAPILQVCQGTFLCCLLPALKQCVPKTDLCIHVVLGSIRYGSVWVQIPFQHFVISTALGLQPTNIVFVQAGASLGSLHSWRDLYGPRSITLLTLCLLAALLPIVVRRHWLKSKPGRCPLQPVSATVQTQHWHASTVSCLFGHSLHVLTI